MLTKLESLSREAGLQLTATQLDQLAKHLSLVLEAAQLMNLTAIRDPDAAARLHAVDSLLAAPSLADAPPGRLLDIGSGAGYPGIPLSIVSGRETTLLEATRKKCAFLEECIASIELPSIGVCCGRAEELALIPDMRSSYTIVTTRAVADLPVLLELSVPFLAKGGFVVSMKGRLAEEEIDRGDAASKVLGLRRVGVRRYRLPGGDEERAVVTYVRLGDPSVALPRRVGMANKRPLG